MKHDKAMQLVAALRSGEHKQGRGYLHTADGLKCCLGVACCLSSLKPRLVGDEDEVVFAYGRAEDPTRELSLSVRKHFGFYGSFGSRRDGSEIEIDNREFESLAAANDAGVSFTDIADYIEKNWEAL